MMITTERETNRFDQRLLNGGVMYMDSEGIEHFRGTNARSLMGATLYDRYELHNLIGLGTFGCVYKMTDATVENHLYAMKIEPVTSATARQVEVLAAIKKSPNSEGKFYFVKHYDSFNIVISKINYLCTAMDQYGCNVFQFMRHNTKGFTTTLCFIIIKQVLTAFSYLHEVARVAHLDFKPENVVFVSWRRHKLVEQGIDVPAVPNIRIVDFNSATLEEETVGRTACTIHYRPPEACFRLRVNRLADIWSIGCFAYYIHQRALLFSNTTDIGVLLQQERTVGPFPKRMLESVRESGSNLVAVYLVDGRHKLCLHRGLNTESLAKCRPLRLHYNRADSCDIAYYSLMRAMLVPDVDARLTAAQLLSMPIFTRTRFFQTTPPAPMFMQNSDI